MSPSLLHSRSATVDGLEMHAQVTSGPAPGEAPTVVLVHGVGVSSRSVEGAGRELAARGFAVGIPDLPGHGRTDAPRGRGDTVELADSVVAWMDAVRVERAHLLGQSYGCQVATEVAVRHPGRVDRVVLQGPTCEPGARGWIRQLVRWVRNGLRESTTQHDVTFSDWRRVGLVRLVRTASNSLHHPIEDRLPLVGAPLLVVRGERDAIISLAWAQRAAALAPHGRLGRIPAATHTVTTTEPGRLVEFVASFLAGEEPGAETAGGRPDASRRPPAREVTPRPPRRASRRAWPGRGP